MNTTKRLTFSTSRLADFTSAKGLVALVGVGPEDWPLVIIKELIDNAADACEDAGIAPHVKLAIEDGAIVVEDNGPGVDPDVVRRICDYSQNTSRNAAYVGPTRGQQGNAMQTLFAMPYVAHGGHDAVGVTIIESQGVRHTITFSADPVTREPKLDYQATETAFTDGTRVTVNWPHSLAHRLVGYASRFLWFNPHLRLTIDGRDFGPSKPDWSKWKPGATSAHWYGLDQFKRLIGARAANDPEATVRDFVRMFDGLTAKDRAAAIIGAVNAERETLAEFAGSGDKRIERLLTEMQKHSKAVAPERLGVLGRNHLSDAARRLGVEDLSRFEYRRAAYVADADGLPYVAEVAFAYAPHLSRRFVLAGLNFSPDFPNRSPFHDLDANAWMSLDDLLNVLEIDPSDRAVVFVHLVSPRFEFTSKAKTEVVLPPVVGKTISDLVTDAAKRWTKLKRKAKGDTAKLKRAMTKPDKTMTYGEALRLVEEGHGEDVMTRAYLEASDDGHGGRAPVQPRQIYYKARPYLLRLIGKECGGQYFSQSLLPAYLREHRDETVDWDITSKPRGTLHEPHTLKAVRLGTVEVRKYIGKFGVPDIKPAAINAPKIATHGPEGRYNGVLYIEKEGFTPQIERARIAERYDIAIVSDEGMSTVAARQLIDEVCGRLGKPLFTMHDFDITGLDIQHRIFNSNNRYQFRHEIGTVIDFGLRLADVNGWELQSEPVDIPGDFQNLSAELAAEKRENWLDATEERLRDERGATEEEIEFLLTDGQGERGATMKRVELNALDAQNFVAFIEAKLEEHGFGKVTPDSETLADAYAAFVRAKRIRARLGVEIDRLNAEPVDIPDDLVDRLDEMLEDDPETSWDAAVETLADADGG